MKKLKSISNIILVFTCFLAFSGFRADSWKSTSSKEGKFTVMMPDKSVESSKEIPSDIGNLVMHLFMYDASAAKDDNLIYLACYIDYPDSYKSFSADEMDVVLNSAVDGAVKNVQGKLLSKKNISKNGAPGKDFMIDFQDGSDIIHSQAYLVKNRMYLVETIYATANKGNKSDERFMNSFNFTN